MKALPIFVLLTGLNSWPAAIAQVSVLTSAYDNSRTGLNANEKILTPANVNVQSFGKLFSLPVDGSVYAQPLYAPGVIVPGRGTHNVLYVCTMNDSVYAFDADIAQSLWSVNFTNAAAGVTAVPIADITGSNNLNIVGLVGIESTPVIDPATQTLYLVARTKEVTGSITSYVQRLHALSMTTGVEKFGGPIIINASVPGSGQASSGGMVRFDGKMNNQRSSLALANGKVMIAWASHEDDPPYHGWVMAYDAATLAQVGVFCPTPNGSQGGVWMSGRAPVVDGAGNVYYFNGNGSSDNSSDYGESALKFSSATGLALADYFTASNAANLNAIDFDFGSSGPLMLPGTSILAGGGKEGALYLLDANNLGHFVPGDTQIRQKLQVTSGAIKPGPAYWQSATRGPLLYLWGESDTLKAWHFNGNTLDASPVSQSTVTTPNGGAAISISANGSADSTAILWASVPVQDADQGLAPGALHAFKASDLTQELWNSLQLPSRDDTGLYGKFVPPVVVNGKVYVASFSNYSAKNYVNVYGLLGPADFALSASPGSVSVTAGSAASYTVALKSLNGFTGVVSLSATGLPAGAAATFSPSTITTSGTATLTVTTAVSTPPGSYAVTIVGTSGTISHSISVTLGVSAGAPVVLSVTPSSGAGSIQAFSFAISDANGYANLAGMNILFNTSLNGINACWMYYDQTANTLALASNDTSVWSQVVLGSSGTLQNSQCGVSGSTVSVQRSGPNLTLTLTVTLSTSFAGTKTIYVRALDKAGPDSGYQAKGTWTIPATSSGPAVLSVTPSAGSGLTSTFSVAISDSAGYLSLAGLNILLNTSLSGVNACWLYYDRAGNTLAMASNSGSAWTQIQAGSPVALTNSQCTVNGSTVSTNGAGSNFTFRLTLTFTTAFAGAKTIYIRAVDIGGHDSGYQAKGTWSVP